MPESKVVKVAREYREQLARNEDEALRRMARSWTMLERELYPQYLALAQEIREMADAGIPIPQGMIYQRRRYYEMMAQIDKYIAEYDKTTVEVISDYQRENFNLGLDNAKAQIKASDPKAWIWNEVSRDSAEVVVGFAGNGAPLAELLKTDYGEMGESITDAIISGIALGKGSIAVARDIQKLIGEQKPVRSMRIARTEINRAYRIANAEQYQKSGVVEKVLRLCYPPTACFACLMMDGEECPNGMCDDHPNGKCTTIAVTIGGHYPEWQKGSDWLLEQDEATQRRIMGDGRYELWQKDGVPLRDMVEMKYNPVWGGSPSSIPLKELRKEMDGTE